MRKIIILALILGAIGFVIYYFRNEIESSLHDGLVWDEVTGQWVSDPQEFIAYREAHGGSVTIDQDVTPPLVVAWGSAGPGDKLKGLILANGNSWLDNVANVPLKNQPAAFNSLSQYLSALHEYFTATGQTWNSDVIASATNYYNSQKNSAPAPTEEEMYADKMKDLFAWV